MFPLGEQSIAMATFSPPSGALLIHTIETMSMRHNVAGPSGLLYLVASLRSAYYILGCDKLSQAPPAADLLHLVDPYTPKYHIWTFIFRKPALFQANGTGQNPTTPK